MPSYLKTLDTIHHQGIRLTLGAFRTSPADSLFVEANEPSLKDRREKLSLKFGIKLKSNPTYKTVFRPNFCFLKRNQMLFQYLEFESPQHLLQALKKVTLPWTLNKSEDNFSLTADKKDNTDAFIFKTKFQDITSHYLDFKHIYTDGSKDGPKVAVACVSRTQTRKCRLPDNASIFSAESQAINMALGYIEEANLSKFICFLRFTNCTSIN